ncbi:probable cytochrome P450 CYP44 [Nilaparvata lugens]|uniref:probable cytochrome P450 CYP44 n=1 Tax=Nilaparvata lugens TaxID=108931 RepID=UPI00193E083B|nr:probable cytochrome P450 CYP44 [Nilaparvata lugens]XP_039290579.1 probable cytochrome P450 CYP44 [Nilaparvata lugens]XP_039290580.1 probable cytochrome P450 CYP44 [Nilaparvata lugens]
MSLKKIPGPTALPVVGNLYQYMFNKSKILKYHEVLQQLYEKYGPIVRETFGNKTIIHLFDPVDAKTVLDNEDKRPFVVPLQETTLLYRKKSDMSLGLGNTNGEEWYRLRSAIKGFMFDFYGLRNLSVKKDGVFDDIIKKLGDEIDDNGQVKDLRMLFGKWALESSGITCFDRRLGYLDNGEMEKLAEKIIEANKEVFYLSGLLKFSFPFYKYFPTPKWIKLEKAEDVITNGTKYQMEKAYDEMYEVMSENRGDIPNDRFEFLTDLRKKLNKKEITTIMLSVHTDGLSTIVPSLLFNLYCLAINPEIQEKAYQEVKKFMSEGAPATKELISQSMWVSGTVKETFRFFPIGTEIARILKKDLPLSGHNIPQGSNIHINMNVHFFNEQYFKNPRIFNPIRWSDGLTDLSEDAKRVRKYVLMPFGANIRSCAGRLLADQDLILMVSRILYHYQLVYPENEKPLQQVFNTLLVPDRNPPIRFIKRS